MKKKPKKPDTNTDRVATIINLLCIGLNTAEIKRWVKEKTNWEAKPETIKKYIGEAAKILRSNADYDRDYHLGQAIDRLNELYKRALSIQDIKAALAAQKELNQLLGLEQPKEPEESTEPAEKTRKKTDIEKLYDAIDDNLGELADGINSTYTEIVEAAAEQIKSQAARIKFLSAPKRKKAKPKKRA